ncbi:hypothetical protein F4810DRAFT_692622, partial [Camillea tinctor]
MRRSEFGTVFNAFFLLLLLFLSFFFFFFCLNRRDRSMFWMCVFMYECYGGCIYGGYWCVYYAYGWWVART